MMIDKQAARVLIFLLTLIGQKSFLTQVFFFLVKNKTAQDNIKPPTKTAEAKFTTASPNRQTATTTAGPKT